jgi:hypothetical protein
MDRLSFGLGMALLAVALVGAGCATTPDARIRPHRAIYEAMDPEDQLRIRRGEVQAGDSRQVVEMALGRPDRVSRVSTAEGEQEVWLYGRTKPRLGFSVGVGTGSVGRRSTVGVGTSVGVGTGGNFDYHTAVTFRGNEASQVDRRQR